MTLVNQSAVQKKNTNTQKIHLDNNQHYTGGDNKQPGHKSE